MGPALPRSVVIWSLGSPADAYSAAAVGSHLSSSTYAGVAITVSWFVADVRVQQPSAAALLPHSRFEAMSAPRRGARESRCRRTRWPSVRAPRRRSSPTLPRPPLPGVHAPAQLSPHCRTSSPTEGGLHLTQLLVLLGTLPDESTIFDHHDISGPEREERGSESWTEDG